MRFWRKSAGETRKIIAEQLGTTPAQVGRYDSIEKHLIPRIKGWMEQGKIGISVAYELSMLLEEVQEQAAAELWRRGRPVTLEDVRKWKTAEREAEKKQTGGERKNTGAAEDAPPPPPPPAVKEVEAEPERPAVENTGKVVDFPAPPSPLPAEDAPEPGKELMHTRMAANILEDLQTYCEEMLAVEAGQADTWMERADALAVAIAVLRK